MSANVHGQMVYSFEKPMWHNITAPSLVPMGAEEILDARFGGGFPIYMRPMSFEMNGERVEDGDIAIVRGDSPYEPGEYKIGVCTERYNPLQPRDICKTFDENVKEYAETMGFLGHGEDMFISWEMPEFDVVVGDTVKLYGCVRSGFTTMKATRLFTTAYRPICENTINLAENWAKGNTDGHGKGQIWKGRGVNKNLLRDLGYWMEHVQGNAVREATMLQDFFGRLAKLPILNDEHAKGFLSAAYPDVDTSVERFPVQLREEQEKKYLAFNGGQATMRDGIFDLFGGAGTGITATRWGMLNATSEYFCHVQPSKRPIAESVMFGGRQKNIMKMVTALAV